METACAVLTGVERRRRFSAEEKRRLVAKTLRPGASVAAVAREHGVHPNQLFKWRRLGGEGGAGGRVGGVSGPVRAGGAGRGGPCAREAACSRGAGPCARGPVVQRAGDAP